MRRTPLSPAESLRSVALRNHHPLRDQGRLSFNPCLAQVDEGESPAAADAAMDEASRGERLARLEAVLVLAREPLNTRKLSQYANLADGTEARTLIRQLNQQYDQSGRAFRVEELAGGFQILTRPQFATWLRRLRRSASEVRLSTPALETLAVVAYRQPVCRADIEAIRGVSCGDILRQLMERDQIRISGRSEELGRPYLYSTTKNFLLTFGLRSLDDLPRAESLRGVGLPKPAERTPETDSPSPETTSHKEITVSVATPFAELQHDEPWRAGSAQTLAPRAVDEDFDEDLDELEDEEEDDFEDLEDDDDLDDEDLEDEDDLEEEEWEEVEDDEEFDDDDDEDWEDDDLGDDLDDDEDDDWDDEEELDED